MPEPEDNPNGAANDGTKNNLDESNTTTVQLDLDESKAHLINANGGARGDHDELKTAIIDPTSASSEGEISFNGLGKEEVMRYANDPFWVRLRYVLFILFWLGWLAMLVTAIVIIVLAPRCPPRPDLKWYNTETVYQVFPKSFKDSNNDGVGDFNGLSEKLSYITKNLGIKALWINSIFETDKQSSLGVVDHKSIDESFGVTFEAFQSWLKKLRKEGVKVILDLIPNQTSKNHTWFQASVKNEEPYRDYYVWVPGDASQPPNDWRNIHGDPAWSFEATRGAWYFHQFSKDYPDLNLTNEDVRKEIKDIMSFWFEAGVSGFHVEGLEYLVENSDLNAVDELQSSPTRNYEGTLDLLEDLRTVADQFSDKPGRERLLFGTLLHASKNQTREYWGTDKKRLHVVSALLKDLTAACDASCIQTMVEEQLLTDDVNQWQGIQLGDQNTRRIASRLDAGDGHYRDRLVAVHALQLLLPGTPFNYYGDEFGQRDGNAGTADPTDNYRTPMQWNSSKNAGFTGTGVQPWLPVGPEFKIDNPQASVASLVGLTPFKAFKEFVQLRSNESFQFGKTQVCSPHSGVFIFTRKATRFPFFLTLINTGENVHVSPEELQCVSVSDEGTVVFHSRGLKVNEPQNVKESGIWLDKFDVVVIKFAPDE
ncbi:unnamed protein product [Candidula unifasciata]|uniref:Glycosyl hydrolase family 13 catalytic domain-containing protein n=1 Tax=Candidula unifasciata TaxID=100452 RepID=A0A8S3ZVK1_9EUPU|nr:unnamed protein product [Candidula unifasciata]